MELTSVNNNLVKETAKLLQKKAIDIYLNKEISIKEPIEPKFRFGRWV